MKRGEVWWVNFEPSVGGEIRKERPVVIVSNDVANEHLNRVQVVPLTTAVGRLYPSEAYVTVRRRKHKAMADQLATVSKKRLINRVGRLSAPDLVGVRERDQGTAGDASLSCTAPNKSLRGYIGLSARREDVDVDHVTGSS